MSFSQTTFIGANCPRCQRKLTILLHRQEPATALAICYHCRQTYDFKGQVLPKLTKNSLDQAQKKALAAFVEALPEPAVYKGPGSQLRLDDQQHYRRQWLSLAAYEKQFGEALGHTPIDLRSDLTCCKWCGQTLPSGRRSFCKDSCSRNYSKVTFTKRTTPSLPYRIACRDRFFCQATGADLALYNRFHQRIPASNGLLTIHHLVPVSQQGTDHESNLLTLSVAAHQAYHAGDPAIMNIIDEIKARRWDDHPQQMQYS